MFENYGQPNLVYLLHHGFVLRHNSHDCKCVRMSLCAKMCTYLCMKFLILVSMDAQQLHSSRLSATARNQRERSRVPAEGEATQHQASHRATLCAYVYVYSISSAPIASLSHLTLIVRAFASARHLRARSGQTWRERHSHAHSAYTRTVPHPHDQPIPPLTTTAFIAREQEFCLTPEQPATGAVLTFVKVMCVSPACMHVMSDAIVVEPRLSMNDCK